jgi:hypothetical protein
MEILIAPDVEVGHGASENGDWHEDALAISCQSRFPPACPGPAPIAKRFRDP